METMYYKVAVACEKDEKIFNQLKDRLYAIVLETDKRVGVITMA